MFEITIKTTITKEQVQALMASAFEGGYSGWMTLVKPVVPPDILSKAAAGELDIGSTVGNIHVITESDLWYEAPFLDGGYVEVADEEERTTHKIDKESIQRALEVMSTKYPKTFADILNENDDAMTGDLFMQCLCFGEERYS